MLPILQALAAAGAPPSLRALAVLPTHELAAQVRLLGLGYSPPPPLLCLFFLTAYDGGKGTAAASIGPAAYTPHRHSVLHAAWTPRPPPDPPPFALLTPLQVAAVLAPLAAALGLTSALAAGRLPVDAEAAALRAACPDVLVVTPGRLVAHVTETHAVALDKLRWVDGWVGVGGG